MKKVISEILDSTAGELNKAEQIQAQAITSALSETQPAVMGFLMNAGEGVFNDDEREWFSYLGIALLKSALKVEPALPQITPEMLEKAATDAIETVRKMRETGADSGVMPEGIAEMLGETKQPEMIKFVIAAMGVANGDQKRVREQNTSTMFFFLKILVDTMNGSC